MKKFFTMFLLIIMASVFAMCKTDAEIASYNLSKAAEQFQINRRIVFYNGITDKYILSVEGRCSVDFYPDKFCVTCKVAEGEDGFYKHYLGRADNVFPFVEQLEPMPVDVYHYKVIFKPERIIPDVDLKVSK